MFYQQTVVGERVKFEGLENSKTVLDAVFGGFTAHYYRSGTAALASAVLAAIRHKKDIHTPEVLIPAYACPDLVSAIVYAGARPVLVDFYEDQPKMDLGEIAEKITENSVAVIAVNFLGIPEDLAEIRKITKKNEILLIEDSAQAFREPGATNIWLGDLIVLSFGRGKPVNLMGGGAVLCNDNSLNVYLEQPLFTGEKSKRAFLKRKTKVSLYNRLINPATFWWIDKVPFLKLGETKYKALLSIEGIDWRTFYDLPANLVEYIARDSNVEYRFRQMMIVLDDKSVVDIVSLCEKSGGSRLLRYPLLLKSYADREGALTALYLSGVGVSKMYKKPLSEIEGMSGFFNTKGHYPNAASFADRLITLPTHSRVRDRSLDTIEFILKKYS